MTVGVRTETTLCASSTMLRAAREAEAEAKDNQTLEESRRIHSVSTTLIGAEFDKNTATRALAGGGGQLRVTYTGFRKAMQVQLGGGGVSPDGGGGCSHGKYVTIQQLMAALANGRLWGDDSREAAAARSGAPKNDNGASWQTKLLSRPPSYTRPQGKNKKRPPVTDTKPAGWSLEPGAAWTTGGKEVSEYFFSPHCLLSLYLAFLCWATLPVADGGADVFIKPGAAGDAAGHVEGFEAIKRAISAEIASTLFEAVDVTRIAPANLVHRVVGAVMRPNTSATLLQAVLRAYKEPGCARERPCGLEAYLQAVAVDALHRKSSKPGVGGDAVVVMLGGDPIGSVGIDIVKDEHTGVIQSFLMLARLNLFSADADAKNALSAEALMMKKLTVFRAHRISNGSAPPYTLSPDNLERAGDRVQKIRDVDTAGGITSEILGLGMALVHGAQASPLPERPRFDLAFSASLPENALRDAHQKTAVLLVERYGETGEEGEGAADIDRSPFCQVLLSSENTTKTSTDEAAAVKAEASQTMRRGLPAFETAFTAANGDCDTVSKKAAMELAWQTLEARATHPLRSEMHQIRKSQIKAGLAVRNAHIDDVLRSSERANGAHGFPAHAIVIRACRRAKSDPHIEQLFTTRKLTHGVHSEKKKSVSVASSSLGIATALVQQGDDPLTTVIPLRHTSGELLANAAESFRPVAAKWPVLIIAGTDRCPEDLDLVFDDTWPLTIGMETVQVPAAIGGLWGTGSALLARLKPLRVAAAILHRKEQSRRGNLMERQWEDDNAPGPEDFARLADTLCAVVAACDASGTAAIPALAARMSLDVKTRILNAAPAASLSRVDNIAGSQKTKGSTCKYFFLALVRASLSNSPVSAVKACQAQHVRIKACALAAYAHDYRRAADFPGGVETRYSHGSAYMAHTPLEEQPQFQTAIWNHLYDVRLRGASLDDEPSDPVQAPRTGIELLKECLARAEGRGGRLVVVAESFDRVRPSDFNFLMLAAAGLEPELPHTGFDLVLLDVAAAYRMAPGFEWIVHGDVTGFPIACENPVVRDLLTALCTMVTYIPRIQTLQAYLSGAH